jgi:hypothetical protein
LRAYDGSAVRNAAFFFLRRLLVFKRLADAHVLFRVGFLRLHFSLLSSFHMHDLVYDQRRGFPAHLDILSRSYVQFPADKARIPPRADAKFICSVQLHAAVWGHLDPVPCLRPRKRKFVRRKIHRMAVYGFKTFGVRIFMFFVFRFRETRAARVRVLFIGCGHV